MTRHMEDIVDALTKGIEDTESDLESVKADCRRFEIELDEALAKVDELNGYIRQLEDDLAELQVKYVELP